ncbi:MAG: thioredoxin-disulfide reductase [Candidatus Odinarchaeum yellowstonii]|uniref:Thioredoxin-disulfide reductase n=1 Tax=Odinarchaeota yellowstonii (strain LCB_4) TaxID=1841599 RepID=A0AAF0IBM8_ODILC|nr:MAG: thioredoxin-disulfide reductase [Candidatus Odinarchaeum yellowstonii]
MVHYNLCIIGGGPAGMTAAIYAGRSGLSTIIIDAMALGGAMATAPIIENYPGWESITGLELARIMRKQVEKAGVEIREMEKVVEVKLQDKVKTIKTDLEEYTCDSVIIATGGERKRLGAKGEADFYGKGVSYCAVCDGALYKDKNVIVVGGGNCAASAALYLKNIARNVTLIHRRDDLRCESVLKNRLLDCGVKIIWNSVIRELKGDKTLKTVIVENTIDRTLTELPVDGLFIEIGIVPNSSPFHCAGVKVDEAGYIIVDKDMKTNIPGVFAAGDVTGGVEQISVAVGKGTIAYNSAYEYIRSLSGKCEL